MSVFDVIKEEEFIINGRSLYSVYDKFPVSKGHVLIISKIEKLSFFDLNNQEKAELIQMIDDLKVFLDNKFNPDGYNIGMNCGVTAGQTVMHFHCHIIPRYKGDMKDPKGGVRHCVEGKGYY